MMFDIKNALEHVFLYGYFEHAYGVYFSKILKEGDDVIISEPSSQLIQLKTFESIRDKLRGNTYLSPTLIGLTKDQTTQDSFYPFTIRLTPDEKHWLKYILKIHFRQLQVYTKKFYKYKSLDIPTRLYEELYRAFRTEEAIEFLRKKYYKEIFQTNLSSTKSESISLNS